MAAVPRCVYRSLRLKPLVSRAARVHSNPKHNEKDNFSSNFTLQLSMEGNVFQILRASFLESYFQSAEADMALIYLIVNFFLIYASILLDGGSRYIVALLNHYTRRIMRSLYPKSHKTIDLESTRDVEAISRSLALKSCAISQISCVTSNGSTPSTDPLPIINSNDQSTNV